MKTSITLPKYVQNSYIKLIDRKSRLSSLISNIGQTGINKKGFCQDRKNPLIPELSYIWSQLKVIINCMKKTKNLCMIYFWYC